MRPGAALLPNPVLSADKAGRTRELVTLNDLRVARDRIPHYRRSGFDGVVHGLLDDRLVDDSRLRLLGPPHADALFARHLHRFSLLRCRAVTDEFWSYAVQRNMCGASAWWAVQLREMKTSVAGGGEEGRQRGTRGTAGHLTLKKAFLALSRK